VVQSGVELAERLLDDSGRWFGAKCPGDRDGSPGQAAEKGVQGDVEAAGPCVFRAISSPPASGGVIVGNRVGDWMAVRWRTRPTPIRARDLADRSLVDGERCRTAR
jgi:hypothetical protein